jgi:tetratricopeptide (TPR) repeat protein
VRKRTLVAIVLTMFALPALASDPPAREAPVAPPNESKRPLSPDTLVAIADVQVDAALAEKTPAADREALLERAQKGYELALKTDPKHKGALLGLAQFFARTDNRDKALEAYRAYLAQYPDAEAAHELALAHARWKDPNGAVSWCEYALKIDPENRSVKKDLGFCLALAGKWDEAFAALCRVMPGAQARHNLGGLLDRLGRISEAKEQLRLALKADPNYTPARDLLREIEGKAARAQEPKPLPLPQKDPTTGPADTRTTATHKLRNVAAADAAHALTTFIKGKNLTAVVVAEPVSNTVLISSDMRLQEQLLELLAELDKEPQQIIAQVMVVEVKREFVERAGLNVGGEKASRSWVLTPRETHMFHQLLRSAREKGECEVLSRPTLQVVDGRTGSIHVGQTLTFASGFEIKTTDGTPSIAPKKETVTTGVTLEVTPRFTPDGKTVRLRADFRVTELTGEKKVPLAVVVNGEVLQTAQFLTVPTFTTR